MNGEVFKICIDVLGDNWADRTQAKEIARRVTAHFLPMLEGYAEACALLDQTLALIDPSAFMSHEAQKKVRDAREFLGGHP